MNTITLTAESLNATIHQAILYPKTVGPMITVIGGTIVALSAMHSTALAIITLAAVALLYIPLAYLSWNIEFAYAKMPALRLLTPDMSFSEIKELIKTLDKVKAENRPEFVTQALHLIPRGKRCFEKTAIIEILGKVKAEEGPELVKQALRLISHLGLDSSQKTAIIEILDKVKAENRPEFVTQALHLIPRDKPCFEKTAIIEILGKVKASERPKFVTLAFRLISPPPSMRNHEKSGLLTMILTNIVPEERILRMEMAANQLERDLLQAPNLNRFDRIFELLDRPLLEPLKPGDVRTLKDKHTASLRVKWHESQKASKS
jgi:hypothetical protein